MSVHARCLVTRHDRPHHTPTHITSMYARTHARLLELANTHTSRQSRGGECSRDVWHSCGLGLGPGNSGSCSRSCSWAFAGYHPAPQPQGRTCCCRRYHHHHHNTDTPRIWEKQARTSACVDTQWIHATCGSNAASLATLRRTCNGCVSQGRVATTCFQNAPPVYMQTRCACIGIQGACSGKQVAARCE